MKFKILLSLIFFVSSNVIAQKKITYQQKSIEVKQKIWANSNSIFEVKIVPEKYNKESAIIIARSLEIERSSADKIKASFYGIGIVGNTDKVSTYRERTKINDKVALEKYSTLEYDKIVNKTESSYYFLKTKTKKEVFIGIKIIKPNGEETIVNPDEEVVLASNSKDQTGKIAVPNLQVGDIIDYYICSIQQIQGNQDEGIDKFTFLLADEYVVLNYAYKFQFDEKLMAFYNSANGAPELETTTNNDKNIIFTLQGKDLPKYTKEIWSSAYREVPCISIFSYFVTNAQQTKTHRIHKTDENQLEGIITSFQNKFNRALTISNGSDLIKQTKIRFESNKTFKNTPLDSSMKYLYNAWKQFVFRDYYNGDEVLNFTERKWLSVNSKNVAVSMCQILCTMEVPHDILIVGSRFSNALEDAFDLDDIEAMIRINTLKPMYMGFDKFFTSFNDIPLEFQGEKAIVLTPEKHGSRYIFTRSKTVVPITPSTENKILEQIDVYFQPEKMQELKIYRNVRETGAMKNTDQLNLLLFEDVGVEVSKYMGEKNPHKTSSDFILKRLFTSYNEAVDLAKNEVKGAFISEITDQYDQKPKELINYKVISSGVTNSSLETESTFTIETFVKKAGNDYILDVGRLIGSTIKIQQDQRIRKMNIYMPSARTLNYNITINVPNNYTVTGFKDLIISRTNTSGSIFVSSQLNGQKLVINVTREYAKIFYEKVQWDNILDLLDEARAFTEKKILLSKIN